MDSDSRDQKCEMCVVKEHFCGTGSGGGSGGSSKMLFKEWKAKKTDEIEPIFLLHSLQLY